jgi:predicted metal-dependent TIM-barrel fold hydrolase
LFRKKVITDTKEVAKVAEVAIKIRTITRTRKEVISHIITIMIETDKTTTKSKLRVMLDHLKKEPNSNLLQFLRKKDQLMS